MNRYSYDPFVTLEAHQYDADGWLVGRWCMTVDRTGVGQYPDWWTHMAHAMLRYIDRTMEDTPQSPDLPRTVWWVRPADAKWPEQPVTLPLS